MSNLTFGKEKRRFNFDILYKVGIWTFQIAIVCTFAFVIVWYLGQKVSNVGDSMKPEIKNGDVVLVNRIIYNASSPDRYDVVVFKPNGNENSHYYVKRIVGLPGETVEIKDENIYINGEKLKENAKIKTTALEDPGIAYEPIELKGNEYFVLGDNRSSSEDSRMADIGNVKKKDIYGKAWFIISPRSDFGFVK